MYCVVLVNWMNDEIIEIVIVVGKYCEFGDIFVKDVVLFVVELGDIMVVVVIGVYNYSMVFNYNCLGCFVVVLVN